MKSKQITTAAITAALYVILTYAARLFNLDSGIIQVRFSEALCILPCFSAAAVPGLFIGCLLSNVLVANAFWDVIFGSIATLIGAYFTHKLRSRPVLAVIPPILSNTIIIPFILSYVYNFDGSLLYFAVTVGIGEIISCGILGGCLYSVLKKYKKFF